MLSHGLVNTIAVTDPIDGVNNAIDLQVAKNQSDLEQEIVILSQLHVINLQRLHDLDGLAVRWNTTDICSLCQGDCESILIEMEMMQKMGTPAPYGGFPLTNLKFKTWLHLEILINTEAPLTNINCPPPVSCNGWKIDMSAFPIRQPHPNYLRLVCFLIERSLLPHIGCVIDHHEHKFVTHNIAHLLCKGHLDDISALLLFHHIKLATLKEDNTKLILRWLKYCFIVIDVKVIVDECMINLTEIICHPSPLPPHIHFKYCPLSQSPSNMPSCCFKHSISLCCCHCPLFIPVILPCPLLSLTQLFLPLPSPLPPLY
jgi:hypothetical protein